MTAAASNAVKLELLGSVSISNAAGGGMPRFLRLRFVAGGIFRLSGDPNASIRVFSSMPPMPPPQTMIGLSQLDRRLHQQARNQVRWYGCWVVVAYKWDEPVRLKGG